MNFKFIKADRSVMKRSMVLIILLVLLFSLSVSSLVRIQIVDGEEYKQKAELQQLSDKTLSANRGKIMDANNIVLAESATAWKIYVDPSEVSQDSVREKIAEDLNNTVTGLLEGVQIDVGELQNGLNNLISGLLQPAG